MPSSLKFIAVLLTAACFTAVISLSVLYLQNEAAADATARALTGGDPEDGKVAVERYGCGACHQVGSASGMKGQVGPPLTGLAKRAELAGRLPNDPRSLIRWVRFPQEIAPGSGMPDQDIGDKDARDIAAYLYTLP